MKKLLFIFILSLLSILPVTAQDNTPVCHSPFQADVPESDIVMTVDAMTISGEQFANRIRFEQAYNHLNLQIRVSQITQMAESLEQDAATFLANDTVVQRINAENADPLLLGNRVLADLRGDAIVWAYIGDNNIEILSEDVSASIAHLFNFTDQNTDEREVTIDSFNQNLFISGATQADITAFYCRQTAYDLVEDAIFGDVETTLYADVDHILVSSQDVALDIINLINAGDDFASLAQELSLDVGSAERGGNIGENPVDLYVPEFADAVREGEIGTLLAPVQTQFGWHVIRINSKEERPIEDNQRDTILTSLFNNWRNEQMSASTVTINPDWQSFIPEL